MSYVLDRAIVPINKAWSVSVRKKLAKKIEKVYKKDSDLHIQFNVGYKINEQVSTAINA